jgi:hypothetical protein
MLKPYLRILIVAALCVAGLIGLVVRESTARDSGTEVLLAMEAVDPRTLLSGHYVIISLRESLGAEEPCPAPASENPWLALAPHADVHGLAGSAPTREEALQIAPVVVRGTFNCSTGVAPSDGFPGAPGWVMLDLSIDRFYANQGEAERIDRVLRAQQPGAEARVYAIVSVGEDGRARLRGLLVDGERLELGWS